MVSVLGDKKWSAMDFRVRRVVAAFVTTTSQLRGRVGWGGGAEEAYQRWGEQVDKKLAEDSRSDRKRNLQIDQVA